MTPDELRALAVQLEASYYGEPARNAADYLRAQADAQPVPAGWKLVPVEPTPKMLSAVGMMDGYDWHAPGCSPDADHANWYSAMIAAAPAAPQAEPHRNQPLRDLLAVIHCDGGHHTEAVGIEQSIKDAQAAVCELKRELAMGKRDPVLIDLLKQAEKCLAAGVRVDQTAPDEPPISEWDYEADRLSAEIFAWLKVHGIGGSDGN